MKRENYETIASVAATSRFRFSRDSIAVELDKASGDRDGAHEPRFVLNAPDMPMMGLTVERLNSGQSTRNPYQHSNLTTRSTQTASEERPECQGKHTIYDDLLSSCSSFGTSRPPGDGRFQIIAVMNTFDHTHCGLIPPMHPPIHNAT
jgi:hypothetical protein